MGDEQLIFETRHGSRAYGTALEGSDEDFKGVFVGPREWYFGWIGGPDQIDVSPDHVRFDVRKFIRLAAGANPTVLELLFTDPEDHVVVTELGQRLLDARRQFLSRRVADRFGGYALGQLKRIRTHRKWLLDPPTHQPTRAEFGLPEQTLIPADQLAAASSLLDSAALAEADVSANFIELLHRERRYKAAQQHWKQYQSWRATRNEARSELEREFGYDTKHAMHLVRLQRMALEILQTGEVHVRRPDRDELLAIRAGALSYDELEEQAERVDQEIRVAAETSALPPEPDDTALDALCVDIVERALSLDPSR